MHSSLKNWNKSTFTTVASLWNFLTRPLGQSGPRVDETQSSLPLQMNLKDIPLQCTQACTSWPNPLPDAAAFISFSDLLCFQTGAPHLLISRHSKQNRSYWKHPHVPTLFGIPPPSADSSPGLRGAGVFKSDPELLDSDWWQQMFKHRTMRILK